MLEYLSESWWANMLWTAISAANQLCTRFVFTKICKVLFYAPPNTSKLLIWIFHISRNVSLKTESWDHRSVEETNEKKSLKVKSFCKNLLRMHALNKKNDNFNLHIHLNKKALVWLGLYEIKLSEKVLERLGLRVSILYLQRYCCLQKPASFLRYSLPDQYLPKSRKPTWNSKTVLNPLNQFGWITRHLPILTKGQTTGFKWYGLISWIKFYSVKINFDSHLGLHSLPASKL